MNVTGWLWFQCKYFSLWNCIFYCLSYIILLALFQMELLQNFYETTLDALKEAKNERLWFKTNTKLGKLYYDREDYNKLQKILKQLHQSCQVRNWNLCSFKIIRSIPIKNIRGGWGGLWKPFNYFCIGRGGRSWSSNCIVMYAK